VLILAQRQAVLVAKQAASLNVLCGGRVPARRRGCWNPVEFGEGFEVIQTVASPAVGAANL
jgi:hypothetical protein